MRHFLDKHGSQIGGVLSGFDRLIFRGYLRGISYPSGMGCFLSCAGVLLKNFKAYAQATSARVIKASLAAALAYNRPVIYLAGSKDDKQAEARKIAQRDQIETGLVCVFKTSELRHSFKPVYDPKTRQLVLKRERRKCLHLYHYFSHPRLGFLHVRLQTWFPFDLQVWMNGREILARQLDRAGLQFRKEQNAILEVEDFRRAQGFLWAQSRFNWLKYLNALARSVNPAMPGVFAKFPIPYYWCTHESEWATDFLFNSPDYLARCYREFVPYAMRVFDSASVMRFLRPPVPSTGRVHRNYRGEVKTEYLVRPEGICVRHSADGNGQKMYDKCGQILRLENTLNHPRAFKAFRTASGDPSGKKKWRALRKSVVDMARRATVAQAANERYANALAACECPRRLEEDLTPICQATSFKGKRIRAFRPLDPEDQKLLKVISNGAFTINGFRNRDLRAILFSDLTDKLQQRQASGRVTRKLQLLRAHGLVQKVAHTHRYQMTHKGRQLAAALLSLPKIPIEQLVQAAG